MTEEDGREEDELQEDEREEDGGLRTNCEGVRLFDPIPEHFDAHREAGELRPMVTTRNKSTEDQNRIIKALEQKLEEMQRRHEEEMAAVKAECLA